MEKPDWNNWQNLMNVELWQIAALSLNANPANVGAKYNHRFDKSIDDPFSNEFERRLHFLASYNPLLTRNPRHYLRRTLGALPSWAYKITYEFKWDVPNEFMAIADTVSLVSPAELPPLAQRATELKPVRHKLRINLLDAPIKKAIALAGNLELACVYAQLRELAVSGELPFTGEVEGNALCYTNDDNKPDRLTRDALRKRLKNHILPASNGG